MTDYTKVSHNAVMSPKIPDRMNQPFLRLLFCIICSIFLYTGCQKIDDLKDIDVEDWDSEFAIPLFTSHIKLQDILENFDSTTFITIDQDGLIHLNYKGNVTSKSSLDIFEVVNELDGLPLPVTDTFVALPFKVPTDEVDLDFGIMKTGTIEWLYRSEHKENIRVVVEFPNITTPSGKVLSDTIHHNYSGNPIIYPRPKINLSGYRVTPDQDSIYVRYELLRKQSGIRDTLANFFVTIRNFSASYVEGYLGTEVYDLERDTIEIDLFENWTRGDVYFSNPTLLVTVENSFGFPVRSKANIMDVITVDGTILQMRSIFLDSIDFNYPSLAEVGQTKYTYFTFDKNNSNIDSVLGAGPVAVDYEMVARPNPDQDTTIRGFLTDSSAFKVQVEVDLPLYGQSIGFAAHDTITVDFSAYEDARHVEFKLITENEMPLQIDLQLFFVDASGLVLDSLFQTASEVVEAAPVDMDGNVTDKTKKVSLIPFDGEKFDRIKAAKKVYMDVSFSTFNNGQTPVKVLATQDLNVRMGMKVGL